MSAIEGYEHPDAGGLETSLEGAPLMPQAGLVGRTPKLPFQVIRLDTKSRTDEAIRRIVAVHRERALTSAPDVGVRSCFDNHSQEPICGSGRIQVFLVANGLVEQQPADRDLSGRGWARPLDVTFPRRV